VVTDEFCHVLGLSLGGIRAFTGSEVPTGKLRVIDFLSLDGVMQAPGQPEEDTEGGFKHGGWAVPYHDERLAESVAESMAQTDAYLFGRKTYEKFAAYWPTAPREIPFTDHLNNTAKYVVSKTLKNPDLPKARYCHPDQFRDRHPA
jgi:dihydrofolate reductase